MKGNVRYIAYLACILSVMVCSTVMVRYRALAVPSYWVWAGVPLPEDSGQSHLYLFQGIFQKQDGGVSFSRRGVYPHPMKSRSLNLVFRLESLEDPEPMVNAMTFIASEWERHDVRVRGIQLDFDSPTVRLDQYAAFLKRVRGMLPERYGLSVTGLGDWLMSSRDGALRAVSQYVDSIVFQLYTRDEYIEGLEGYLSRLKHLTMPYRVGLIDRHERNGSIHSSLSLNPFYRGGISFIFNIRKEPS